MPKGKTKSTSKQLINRSVLSRFLRWNSPALWVVVAVTILGGTFVIYQSHAATVTSVPCSSDYRVGILFKLGSGYSGNPIIQNCVRNIQTIVYGYQSALHMRPRTRMENSVQILRQPLRGSNLLGD